MGLLFTPRSISKRPGSPVPKRRRGISRPRAARGTGSAGALRRVRSTRRAAGTGPASDRWESSPSRRALRGRLGGAETAQTVRELLCEGALNHDPVTAACPSDTPFSPDEFATGYQRLLLRLESSVKLILEGGAVDEPPPKRMKKGVKTARGGSVFCCRPAAGRCGPAAVGQVRLSAHTYFLAGMLIVASVTYPVNLESSMSLKTLSATCVASSRPTSAVSSAE